LPETTPGFAWGLKTFVRVVGRVSPTHASRHLRSKCVSKILSYMSLVLSPKFLYYCK